MNYKPYMAGLAAALITVSCGNATKDEEDEGNVETILLESTNEVSVMNLELTNFHHELVSNGKLVASQYADLHFESAEPVAAVWVRNGDAVTKGQKIAELSTFRLNNRTIQAKNELEKAYLELQDVLIGQGFSPTDSAGLPAEVRQLAATRSGYDQALAQYSLAVHEEEQAVLRAPFDGVVANLFAKPWNISSSSEVFCSIINARQAEASFTVLESELPLIRKGDRVEVSPFFALEGGSVEGVISEINPMVDAGGVVKVKASVNNPGQLVEGMNVRVSVQRSIGNRLVVPKTAVVIRSGKQVVFTLVDGKAYWNYVQTGLENSSSYTITEGLKDGDIVITDGNINLAHESTVTVGSGKRLNTQEDDQVPAE
ncbi:MAG: efflux RND transporter periplasmic adaptor subunit [Tannerellaceae bacterium]|jgi:RND family efflux transporter MFP subunit|nr:efflux RND transporter periplasmic adaptor subunit [Tannerellaceae bacterium]